MNTYIQIYIHLNLVEVPRLVIQINIQQPTSHTMLIKPYFNFYVNNKCEYSVILNEQICCAVMIDVILRVHE